MSRMSVVVSALLATTFVAFTAQPTGIAQERRDDPAGFDGQFVSIVKKSNPNSSTDLEKVQVRKVDGRSFIVGIGADVPDNWQKGRTVWVALDDVSEVTMFATLEELRKAGTPGEVKKEGQR